MARIEKNENTEKKQLEIPEGNSVEEINLRKKIILDFYREWKQQNPTQRKYNVSLKEYVNIRNVSINETCYRASKTYLSTLAVLQLDAVFMMAKKIGIPIKKALKSASLDLPRNAGGSRTETIGLRADLADGRAELPSYICCKINNNLCHRKVFEQIFLLVL